MARPTGTEAAWFRTLRQAFEVVAARRLGEAAAAPVVDRAMARAGRQAHLGPGQLIEGWPALVWCLRILNDEGGVAATAPSPELECIMAAPDDRHRRLSEYLEGDLDEEHRAALEAEVLADPGAVVALADAVALEDARRTSCTAPHRPPIRWSRRRRIWVTAVPAAVVVALLGLWSWGALQPTAPEPATDDTPVTHGIEPAGEVAAPVRRFAWTAHPGASHYRLVVHDAAGRRQHAALIPDTVVVRGQPGFPDVVDSLQGRLTWRAVPMTAGEAQPAAPLPLAFTPVRR